MHPKLKEAVRLFNRREYFDSHQVLEEVWREADAPDKTLYEALIRLATGLHMRFNRGSAQGAINLLTQALMRLEDLRPTAQGIDVARLYRDVDTHVTALRAEDKPKVGFFERWKVLRIYPADRTQRRS